MDVFFSSRCVDGGGLLCTLWGPQTWVSIWVFICSFLDCVPMFVFMFMFLVRCIGSILGFDICPVYRFFIEPIYGVSTLGF